ncbi:MAG: 2-C-methyl-D-erythritol 4-phosphate cytidylyltransferase [Spirochaetales bacterium]|nr:2-C-methyl-D-erythritol 4-phosphate cytidylyltransferase [Candidatus Physcosoma equi]
MHKGFALVITAAGSSERFNSGRTTTVKKEYLEVGGHTVITSALRPFLSFQSLKGIVITLPRGHEENMKEALSEILPSVTVPLFFVYGGSTRTESVRNAVLKLKEADLPFSYIAIHDGARPFVSEEIIQETLSRAEEVGGAAPGLIVSDAVKRIGKNGLVEENLDRSGMVRVQTPQVFEKTLITRLYEEMDLSQSYPDDIELYTRNGGRCMITKGSEDNKKITYLDDIPHASEQIDVYLGRHKR